MTSESPSNTQPLTVLLYGRAGSGKGTQVQLLKGHLEKTPVQPLVVETGAAFRSFVGSDTYTGKLTKEKMGRGELPEVFIPVWLWTGVLVEKYSGTEHLIFDGFPRRIIEAQVLDTAFTFYDRAAVTVLVLNISPEKTLERLKLRNRADDATEEQIKARNAWYENDVVPTIEYFRTHPRYSVIDINGDQSVEAVQSDIVKALGLTAAV
jgi:adenylate kinase family enzyme